MLAGTARIYEVAQVSTRGFDHHDPRIHVIRNRSPKRNAALYCLSLSPGSLESPLNDAEPA